MGPIRAIPAAASHHDSLSQIREGMIKKPKLSKTPISDVFVNAAKMLDLTSLLEDGQDKRLEKIQACLLLGVDVNSRHSESGHSALYESLSYGNKKVFDFLVDHPDLDVEQLNREEILTRACWPGQEAQLRRLCQLPGIDANP